MSRLPLDMERAARIAENALYLCGEEEVFLSEVGQLEVLMAGLEHADELDEALASGAVEEAKVTLTGATAHLVDIQHRNEQKRRIRAGIQKRFEKQRRDALLVAGEIERDATAVGVKHLRPVVTLGVRV